MAPAVVEAQSTENPHNFNHFIGDNHKLALNQTIEDLLQFHNLSACASTVSRLVQARTNPPLETIWVYSALTYRLRNSSKEEPLDRVSAIKDLLQLISCCSASCSSSKSIVLLAPVIYELHKVIVGLNKALGSKREKKLMREIKSLVNAILGYLSLCCSLDDDGGFDSDSDDLIRPIKDLIHVWIGESSESNEGFKLFFPLLSEDIVGRLSELGCNVSELAGAVITEAVLLKFSLEFLLGAPKPESLEELRMWIVASITGFRHFCFIETLVRVLLEDHLPVTSLLGSEDQGSIKKILYDAVVLVDYSFLSPDKAVHVPSKHIKDLDIARVLVMHEATGLFRRERDQAKVIKYMNAFSSSQLPSQLVKLVTCEIGGNSEAVQPKGLSPIALLNWLWSLEGRGLRVLGEGSAKYRSKLAVAVSEAKDELQSYNTRGTKPDANLFYIDNKGEAEAANDKSDDDEKMNDSASDAFVLAAHAMTSSGKGRKRKEGRSGEKRKAVKYVKYNLAKDSSSAVEQSKVVENDDDSASGSEVENPPSEEDI